MNKSNEFQNLTSRKPQQSCNWKNACNLSFQDKLLWRPAQHNAFWEDDLFFIFHAVCCNHQTCMSYARVPPQHLDTPTPPPSYYYHYSHTQIQTADKCTLACIFILLWWLCSFITTCSGCVLNITCLAWATAERLWDKRWPVALFVRRKWCPACRPSPIEAVFVLKGGLSFWYAEIRNQLVEQFRCLEQQSESRLQLLQDLQEFFRRKAELQLEYSRGLDKLAERYSAKIRTSREHQHFKWVSPLSAC